MDQGRYRRIGETNRWRSAKVRFIFATTENLDEVLLDTFKRRIPIFVEIPSLDKRSVSERLSMIHNFYLNEAKEIGRDLIISRNVINSLISINGSGNIGLLKNIIISSCANAYRNNLESEVIEINIKDLPREFKNKTNIKNIFCYENMKICREKAEENSVQYLTNNESTLIKEEIQAILKIINNLNASVINEEKFKNFLSVV